MEMGRLTPLSVYCSPGSVVVTMVIYTSEATSVADVQNAVESNLQGGCQATSESGETYQTNTCTGKFLFCIRK